MDGMRHRAASGTFEAEGKKRTLANSAHRNSVLPPDDDAVFAVQDDTEFSLFAKGRDYEPVYVTHQYTEQEKETLTNYESCDYLPSHSHIYMHWIKRQLISDMETDRWIMMGLIGFVVGFVGFLLHQLIERIAFLKWSTTTSITEDGDIFYGWLFCVGYSVAFAVFSASIIVLWQPIAGGSGLPEITGFLNGTQMEKIFSIKTFCAKFVSCVTAIGAGMPIGPEGPMIHLGAIIGAGLSQAGSDLFKFRLPIFERFRNPEDRRNFISAGVAAGVSAAFGAPVGGLLFCMEEVSSFWSNTLSWQIFFCCIIATSTSDIFNSAFMRFQNIGTFGAFKTSRYILFNIAEGVDINILMFIPSAIIGVIGGLLGSLFIILNLKVHRFRKRKLATISRGWVVKIIRLAEPALIMVIMSTLSVFVPAVFSCSPYSCVRGNDQSLTKFCVNDTTNKYDSHYDPENRYYKCEDGTFYLNGTTNFYNGTYNEMALLIYGSKDDTIKNLYYRNAHKMFGYGPLCIGLVIYFFMVCWSAGTSVAAGILVPMLVIGGLYGRIIGLAMTDLFGIHLGSNYWNWIDPGAFALIGSASFFSGVARLAPAITVIMMELTNDLKVLLPVMTAVMVAKWVGDFFTHPFFHSVLELKCIPFLNQQPNVRIDKKNVKLELFSARDIMTFPVVTLELVESVPKIAQILLDCSHNGFPVVQTNQLGQKVFYGLITRSELLVLLDNKDIMHEGKMEPMNDLNVEIAHVDYGKMLHSQNFNFEVVRRSLEEIVDSHSDLKNKYIDMTPYVNQSAMCLPLKFSLHRAYTLISALGLRHLTVIDQDSQVQGIITRKDLMGFNMVETLTAITEKRLDLKAFSDEEGSETVEIDGNVNSNASSPRSEEEPTERVGFRTSSQVELGSVV